MPTEQESSVPERPRERMDVMFWGTYDLSKPRTRQILEAVRNTGSRVTEVHANVWQGSEDKSVLSKREFVKRTILWLFAYPGLIFRFLRSDRPDVVVVCYLGHLDVLLLLPFAKLKRTPIVWDAFLSLHDTVVMDRKMVSRKNPVAFFLRAWEWLACRAARVVVLDTDAQAALFREAYRLDRAKVTSAFVGAEASVFPAVARSDADHRKKVLFYGQFIPLHGIPTILEAARLSSAANLAIDWTIIGTGQMADEVADLLKNDPIETLDWIEWVDYPELVQHIASADVCLGVFGDSAKAGRVIPNKVFQILTAGRPLVTRDGPGIRELIPVGAEGIELVRSADPSELLAGVKRLIGGAPYPTDLHADLRARFSNEALTQRWNDILRKAISK